MTGPLVGAAGSLEAAPAAPVVSGGGAGTWETVRTLLQEGQTVDASEGVSFGGLGGAGVGGFKDGEEECRRSGGQMGVDVAIGRLTE